MGSLLGCAFRNCRNGATEPLQSLLLPHCESPREQTVALHIFSSQFLMPARKEQAKWGSGSVDAHKANWLNPSCENCISIVVSDSMWHRDRSVLWLNLAICAVIQHSAIMIGDHLAIIVNINLSLSAIIENRWLMLTILIILVHKKCFPVLNTVRFR